MQFLVEISPGGKPAPGGLVAAGLDELNGRFHTWAEHDYHLRPHSETGATPLARWASCQPRHVSGPELDAAFLWEATRSVHAATAAIRIRGNVYEVDAALAGRTVTLTVPRLRGWPRERRSWCASGPGMIVLVDDAIVSTGRAVAGQAGRAGACGWPRWRHRVIMRRAGRGDLGHRGGNTSSPLTGAGVSRHPRPVTAPGWLPCW